MDPQHVQTESGAQATATAPVVHDVPSTSAMTDPAPMETVNASQVSQEVAQEALQKAAEEQATKDKAEADKALQDAANLAKMAKEEVARQEKAAEEAKLAKAGSVEASTTIVGKTNVFERGLEKALEHFKTPAFEGAFEGIKKILSNLNDATKAETSRDMEVCATRVDLTDAYVAYSVEAYCDTKDKEFTLKLCTIKVAWQTGEMTIEPTTRFSGQVMKTNDVRDFETYAGKWFKDLEVPSEFLRRCLAYSLPAELP